MRRVGWITIVILFISCCQGEVNGNCKESIDYLQAQINELKDEMEKMRHMVKQPPPDTVKSELGSIEEDVQRNAEDILELKLEVIQQDFRIYQVNHDVENLNTSLKETLSPVGTILAWHAGFFTEKLIPSGWQRCDGTLIEMGPLAGQHTPNLNSGRFLRGGADGQSGEFEEDAIQDHIHRDEGHRHSDLGHTHKDKGHSHDFGDEWFPLHDSASSIEIDCEGDCQRPYHMKATYETPIGYSQLSTDSANIETSTSNLGGIEEGRLADETRVKNMKIVWIMRIF